MVRDAGGLGQEAADAELGADLDGQQLEGPGRLAEEHLDPVLAQEPLEVAPAGGEVSQGVGARPER
ncbi:hypothetical protein D3C86_1941700 [compost metagenome]